MEQFHYDFLIKVIPHVKNILDEEQWKRFNMMRSDWVSFSEVAKELGISMLQAIALESPRKCIIKHNGDTENLEKCLKGEIDP